MQQTLVDDYFDDANQELGSSNLTLPMGIGDVNPLIDRLMAEARSDQFLRELVLNSIQSGAKTVSISPSWVDVERTAALPDGPYYRFMIADDGSGMTSKEILDFFNKFSSSGRGLTVSGGNYGVGAKLSCLGWNHHGLLVMSWKDGVGNAARLWREPGKKTYGVRRFTTNDGVFEVLEAPDAYKPDFIKDHGTVIILCGNQGTEDTWLGQTLPSGSSLPNVYSHLSALNNRFFRVPDGVAVSVYAMKANKCDWPKSRDEALLPHRRGRDERIGTTHNVKGQEHFLNRDSLLRGTLDGPGFKIHWYWLNPDRSNLPYVMQGSFIATMYQDEFYDVHRGQHSMSYFSKFGIYRRLVAKQVVLVIEPNPDPATLMTDTARSHLIHSSYQESGEKLPWTIYGDYFRNHMPDVIKHALEATNDSTHEDVNRAIAEDMKEYIPLMARNAFQALPEGDAKLSDDPGGADKNGPGANVGTGSGKRRPNTNRKGRRETTSAKEDGGPAKKINNSSRTPLIVWVSGEEEGIIDRIARYDAISHKLLINQDYKLLKWEITRRLQEDPSLMEYDESEKILDTVVKRVYGLKLTGIVMHHHQNKDTEHWTSDQWESAITPEALTFAVGGYKWAENIINRIVGPMLKKLREE